MYSTPFHNLDKHFRVWLSSSQKYISSNFKIQIRAQGLIRPGLILFMSHDPFSFFLQFLQIAWIRDFFPTQFYILSKVELALKGVNFTVIRKKTSGSTTAIRDHQESRGIRKSYYIVLKYLGVCWPKITIQTGYWIKNSKHRQLQHVFYKFPAEISNICVEFNKTLNFLQTSLNFLLFISGFQG